MQNLQIYEKLAKCQVYQVVGTAASAAIGTPSASNLSPGGAPPILHIF